MHFLVGKRSADRVYQVAIILGNLTIGAALLICAYLGTYSRYLADDYCHTVFLKTSTNIIQATIKSYNVWSDRYSNLSLIQIIDWGGEWGVRFMATVTLVLWVFGLTWLISEIKNSIKLKWDPGINSWIACLIIFLSLFEAPNRYQILYWRAGLVTYLAPLVFFVYIASFILWQIRINFQKVHPLGAGLICFGVIFFSGGSSETTSALQIGILLLALLTLILFMQKKHNRRGETLIILGLSLSGAVLSMLVMALAPGNGVRLNTPTSNLFVLVRETLTYTAQFIWLTLRTLPLPSVVSMVIPFLLTYIYFSQNKQILSQIPSLQLWLTAAAIPAFLFIAIAFSFAPSAYAQSYPVDRARFPAVFLLSFSLSAEGGIMGILASQTHILLKSVYMETLGLLLLFLLSIYPLRAALIMYSIAEPEYQHWTTAWDARQVQIFAEKSQGQVDIVVQQLPGIGYVKELDTRPNFWVNRCAAVFYGVHSLSAPPYGP